MLEGYLRKHGRPKHPTELVDHTALSYRLLATGDHWEFEGPEGKVTVSVNPSMRTNSGDTCRAAALKNKGVFLQPSFMVGDDLRSGALIDLMPQYRSLEFGVYAIYPTRLYVAPKVRALVDFLTKAMRDVPWHEAVSKLTQPG